MKKKRRAKSKLDSVQSTAAFASCEPPPHECQHGTATIVMDSGIPEPIECNCEEGYGIPDARIIAEFKAGKIKEAPCYIVCCEPLGPGVKECRLASSGS